LTINDRHKCRFGIKTTPFASGGEKSSPEASSPISMFIWQLFFADKHFLLKKKYQQALKNIISII